MSKSETWSESTSDFNKELPTLTPAHSLCYSILFVLHTFLFYRIDSISCRATPCLCFILYDTVWSGLSQALPFTFSLTFGEYRFCSYLLSSCCVLQSAVGLSLVLQWLTGTFEFVSGCCLYSVWHPSSVFSFECYDFCFRTCLKMSLSVLVSMWNSISLCGLWCVTVRFSSLSSLPEEFFCFFLFVAS